MSPCWRQGALARGAVDRGDDDDADKYDGGCDHCGVLFFGLRLVGVMRSLVKTGERQAEPVEQAWCPEGAVLALELGLVLGAAQLRI